MSETEMHITEAIMIRDKAENAYEDAREEQYSQFMPMYLLQAIYLMEKSNNELLLALVKLAKREVR